MGNKHGNRKLNKGSDQNKEKKNLAIKPENINETKSIYEYNILFVGETGIGTKTSLIKRIKEGKFIDNIGENEVTREKISYIKDDKKIILYLIDTNAEELKKFLDDSKNAGGWIIRSYLPISDYIIMGYDVTNKKSFEEIKSFLYNKIKEKNKTNLFYLLFIRK